MNMNYKALVFAAATSIALVSASNAATIDLVNSDGDVNSTVSWTGNIGDIQGFFNGVLSNTQALVYTGVNSTPEQNELVGNLTGLSDVDLGGSELFAGNATEWSVPGMSYFTVKTGQLFALLYNSTAGSITVNYALDANCKDNFPNNQCAGSVSNSKHVTVDTPVIPLPAAGWLLLAGVGGLAALRRRKAA